MDKCPICQCEKSYKNAWGDPVCFDQITAPRGAEHAKASRPAYHGDEHGASVAQRNRPYNEGE